jgi:Asp-tRNA(Asn)/Glu-tRNA(Gln) amidotransferase A subunit family amidase
MPHPTRLHVLHPLLTLGLLTAACGPTSAVPDRSGFEVAEASITEMQRALESGDVTSVMLVDAYLARIAAYDQQGPALAAISRINHDARSAAEALDAERAAGQTRGPMHGIPVVMKDNYDGVGMPTTAGNVVLAGMIPPDDAYQVARLREAGAIILAKSSLHEFARGISTVSSLTGQTRNPYDPLRNPGGSSGGTAAAVAASFAAVGWGSDTCGSIRIPASHNNLFGLRPTKGLSSIDGIFPLSHTQDTGGPLSRTVLDLAIALDATVGADSADAATLGHAQLRGGGFVEALDDAALQGVRLGIVQDLFGSGGTERVVNAVIRAAVDDMATLGATVVDVTITNLDSLRGASSLIGHEFTWDAIDHLAATPGAPVGSVERVVEDGLIHEDVMSTHSPPEARETEAYAAAREARAGLRAALLGTLDRERLDAIVYPTMRVEPTRIPGGQSGSNCAPSAQSGLPAISIPAGFTENELPVGVELLGRPFDDQRLVAMAYAFEQSSNLRRIPPTTPPLVDAEAPELVTFEVLLEGEGVSGARTGDEGVSGVARFTLDRTSNEFSYSISIQGIDAREVHSMLLQEFGGETFGRVLVPLSGPERGEAEGAVRLSAAHRAALESGRLVLRVFTRDQPLGALQGALRLPDSD